MENTTYTKPITAIIKVYIDQMKRAEDPQQQEILFKSFRDETVSTIDQVYLDIRTALKKRRI